jgi:hypothetical protein
VSREATAIKDNRSMRKALLVTCENDVVVRRGESIIMGKIEIDNTTSSSEYIFIANNYSLSRRGIRAANVLVTIRDSYVPIRIILPSNESVILRKGSVLGCLEKYELPVEWICNLEQEDKLTSDQIRKQ